MKSYWDWKAICVCAVASVIAGVITGAVLKAKYLAKT